jgi:hypothetical protein
MCSHIERKKEREGRREGGREKCRGGWGIPERKRKLEELSYEQKLTLKQIWGC